MGRQTVSSLAWRIVLLSAAFAAAGSVQAADAKSPYPSMAPLDQYLMTDRQAEISLARSAAPAAVAEHATVLVLAPKGYETAVPGSNGFTCLVERGWMSPPDSPDFWNPKLRGPVCYNPAATRSILPYTIKTTDLALARLSIAQINQRIHALTASKELPMPEPGAMSYMLSKDGNLGDGIGHWHPHLMFHVPITDATSWGANLPGSPVVMDTRQLPSPQTIFFVPVAKWSDGTPAGGY